jgi:tape measure domain-containing protein
MSQNYKISVILDAQGAGKAASDLGKVDAKLNSFGQTAKGALSSFGGNVAASGIEKLTSLALEGGQAVFEYSAKMQQTRIGFETLMGGAESANKHLEELKKFAVETPFDFETLTGASRRLQNVGLEAAKVIPLMRDIGNAAAAAGASSEDLDGITLAFSQIIAKGKVSAEEVNQLAERGIPVWEMLSKTLGKSKAEIIKLSEAGKISSDIFLQAFQKFSQVKFGDAMAKQSQTFNGAWSSIKDIIVQTSADAFQPFFDETSKFTVKFSQSLQEQLPQVKSTSEKFGFSLGESIGDGFRRSQTNWSEIALRVLKLNVSAGTTGFINALAQELTRDVGKGLGEGILSGAKTPSLSIADLRKMDDTISSISNKVLEMPDLAEKLGSAEAEKQTKALNDVIKDLSSQITFFGESSEVAKVKQKLYNAEIYDFSSALAKNALSLAAQLDKLKENEKHLAKLSDIRKELIGKSSDAAFEVAFPNATELDKFDQWVKRNVQGFKELNKEILATRSILSQKLALENTSKFIQASKDMRELQQSFRDMFDQEVRSTRFGSSGDVFLNTIRDFAEKLIQTKDVAIAGVAKDEFDINIFPEDFTSKVDSAILEIERLQNAGLDASGQKFGLSEYLQNLGFVIKDTGEKFALFGAEGADKMIQKWLALSKAVRESEVKEGIKEVDKALEDLGLNIGGFGAKTELEKFNEWLSSPNTTAAIEKRAAAIGMQASALKQLLFEQKAGQLANATRPRIVGQSAQGQSNWGAFSEGLFGTNGVEKIASEAEYIKGVYKDLGQTAAEVVGTMIQGGADLLQQWIATGEVTGAAVRQMTASIIAGLVAQSAVKAIFELAEGYAALAAHDYVGAAAHFASAKIYATVAAVSAAAGIALGAALGKPNGGGSENQNQPDYQTANGSSSYSSGLRESNRNYDVNAQNRRYETEVKELGSAIKGLTAKITSMPAKNVVAIGVKENKGLISDTVINDLNSNGTKATKMGKTLRLS